MYSIVIPWKRKLSEVRGINAARDIELSRKCCVVGMRTGREN